ncbi:MAG: hypothetical protein IRY99_13320 [Isosphaeraceae bacterium]|nr:hypothetical protein [Isosphaeraceae bacterium]
MSTTIFDHICELARTPPPQEKLRLVDELVHQLLHEPAAPAKKPFRSLRGALADLGPAPSAEEIDEARREAWTNFPREDI